jgi:hypothetical protein
MNSGRSANVWLSRMQRPNSKQATPKTPQGNTSGSIMAGTVPFSQNAPRRGRGRASASVSHPPLPGDSVDTSLEEEVSMEVGPNVCALKDGLDLSEFPQGRGGSRPVDQATVVRPETPWRVDRVTRPLWLCVRMPSRPERLICRLT